MPSAFMSATVSAAKVGERYSPGGVSDWPTPRLSNVVIRQRSLRPATWSTQHAPSSASPEMKMTSSPCPACSAYSCTPFASIIAIARS